MKHQKKDKTIVISAEADYINKCYLCGSVEETRPYGENEQEICYDCGMKPENRRTVEKNYQKQFSDVEKIIVLDSSAN